MSRTACATCGETGIGHDGFACRDCDGRGSTPPTQPPAPTGAAAREIVVREMMSHWHGEAEWAVAVTSGDVESYEYGEVADAILSELAEAGLVVVSGDWLETALEWSTYKDDESWTIDDKDALVGIEVALGAEPDAALAARQPEGVRE